MQLGGGIRDTRDNRRLARQGGSARVIIGTAAVRDPALVKDAARAYPGRIAVGLDARDGKVAVEGWVKDIDAVGARLSPAGLKMPASRLSSIPMSIATACWEGLNLAATIALANDHFNSGSCLGRLGLARPTCAARTRPRAPISQAPSSGARSYTGGSMVAALRFGRFSARHRQVDGCSMFEVRIIPCLDVKAGRVVKGVRFVGLRDAGDPVEAAGAYDAAGADELPSSTSPRLTRTAARILDVVAAHRGGIFTPLTVGGGVRTRGGHQRAARAGADKVSINTAAVNDPGWSARPPTTWARSASWSAIDAKRVAPQDEAGPLGDVHPRRARPTGLEAVAWARRSWRWRRRDPFHEHGSGRDQNGYDSS